MKYFLLVFLVSFSCIAFSQTFHINWGGRTEIEDDNYNDHLIAADKDAFYYRLTKTGLKNGALINEFNTVVKATADQKTRTAYPILTQKDKKEDILAMDALAVKNRPFVFYGQEDTKSKINEYFFRKFDGDKFSANIPLISLPIEGYAKFMRYHCSASPDGLMESILLERRADDRKGTYYWTKASNEKNVKFAVTVLNGNGDKVWQNSIEFKDVLEENFQLLKTTVTSEGDIFIVGRLFVADELKEVSGKNKKEKVRRYETVVYHIGNKGGSIKRCALFGLDLKSFSIALNSKNHFYLLGSYNDQQDIPAGMHFMEIDASGEVVKNYNAPLPAAYLSSIHAVGAASKYAESARQIYVDTVLINEKDELTAIAGYKSQYEVVYSGALSEYIFTCGDIYCIKFDKDKSNLIYYSRIPSLERSVYEGLSLNRYVTFLNNKVYIFRNTLQGVSQFEIIENLFKLSKKIDHDLFQLVATIIDEDGKYAEKTIHKTEEEYKLVYPGEFMTISPGKIIVPCFLLKGSTQFFRNFDYYGVMDITP
ncbi:MAG: hypothetical protein JWN78_2847 [Bacteroidota bacterium]|nr:hypothetical protein [Bacteroidota bacterium]